MENCFTSCYHIYIYIYIFFFSPRFYARCIVWNFCVVYSIYAGESRNCKNEITRELLFQFRLVIRLLVKYDWRNSFRRIPLIDCEEEMKGKGRQQKSDLPMWHLTFTNALPTPCVRNVIEWGNTDTIRLRTYNAKSISALIVQSDHT